MKRCFLSVAIRKLKSALQLRKKAQMIVTHEETTVLALTENDKKSQSTITDMKDMRDPTEKAQLDLA